MWYFVPKNFAVTHFTSLHFTLVQNKITSHKSRPFTPHHYTSHHFTSLQNKITSHKSRHFTPHHYTSPHFTSLQNKITSHKSRQFTPHHYTSHHFTYLHTIPTLIPLLVTTFLTLFLSVFSLEGKDASKPAGNWSQILIVLFTKEYLPTSVLFTNICSIYQHLLTTSIKCKIEYHHILRFLRGFTAVFLYYGLGVQSEQNGVTVIYFVSLGRKGYLPIKTKKTQKERQCVCYVTIRRVRATIVAAEKQ